MIGRVFGIGGGGSINNTAGIDGIVSPGVGGRQVWLAVLAVCVVAAVHLPAAAQIHHVEDPPWHALGSDALRRGVEMTWQQVREPRSGWHTDRLGLTFLAPLGERGLFFLRGQYIRFDTAGSSALARWPHIGAKGPESVDNADPEWPFESIINDFARPELGLILPWRLPLLGEGHLGLQAGLPIGTDRLYPMSAGCLPLALDWRAIRGGSTGWRAAGRIGVERTFSSSGDDLDEGAFPGGLRYGFEFGRRHDQSHGVNMAWSARELDGGRHARRLEFSGWLPVGRKHFLRLHVARDLGRQTDRLATWTVGVAWHLAALLQDDEQNDTPSRQNASHGMAGDRP